MPRPHSKKQKACLKSYAKSFIESIKRDAIDKQIPFWKEMFYELLMRRNYNASQIAYRAGISKSIVYKLIKGITKELSHKNFRKLLRLYFAVCYDIRGKKLEDYPEEHDCKK